MTKMMLKIMRSQDALPPQKNVDKFGNLIGSDRRLTIHRITETARGNKEYVIQILHNNSGQDSNSHYIACQEYSGQVPLFV